MKEKNSNFGRREKPQSCSQCREEGHNKGSICCPVNVKNAATATLAKERQTKFSEDQIRENCNNFGKVSNSNLSYEEISSIEVSPILSTGFCSTGFPTPMRNSDHLFSISLTTRNFNRILPSHMDVDDEDLENNLYFRYARA